MTLVVVDANILFSALLREKTRYSRVILTEQNDQFYIPRFAIVEIFKHKERIVRQTHCSEEVLIELSHRLLKRMNFMNEDLISLPCWREAWELVKDIDEKDLTHDT